MGEKEVSISVVVPAFNEAENLPTVVSDLLSAFNRYAINGEIILVNDGSKDNTGNICNGLASRYGNVITIHHEVNEGKTMAQTTGFSHATGEYVFLFESDRQYDSRDIPRFISSLYLDYDIVNGWRRHRSDKLHRILLSKAYNVLHRFLFGTNIYDHNSGFKAFRTEVALKLYNPTLIESLGFKKSYHRVALSLAKNMGFTIDEVPVRHYPRRSGKSYIKSFKTPFETLMAILRLRYLLSFKRAKLTSLFLGSE